MFDRTKMLLLTALLFGIVPGHADTPPVGALPLTIKIDQPSHLLLEKVTYRRTANGIEVSGHVAKQGERRGRILGHVDIRLLDAQGQTLAEHEAALQQFSPSRKNPDWASFATRIEPLPTGVVSLQIGHRVGD